MSAGFCCAGAALLALLSECCSFPDFCTVLSLRFVKLGKVLARSKHAPYFGDQDASDTF